MYSTPHNIQKYTPQNASCEACHNGEGTYFLTADKVKPEEIEANASVVMETFPPLVSMDMYLNAPAMPVDHIEHVSNSCTACHTEGIRNAPVSPENHAEYKDRNCSGCHKLQQ
jgi:cytochrome c5